MAINSTLANQIFFASQGVPATGKENSAGQAYANEVAYAHAATYNPLEVLGGDTKEFVVKIYKTVLGRTNPLQDDPEGVVYWTNAINNGLNKAAFIDEMTAVAIKNGGSDKAAAEAANAAYVNDIYTNILGRPASEDPAGSQYWIDALNKGTIARSKVVDEINAAAAVNKDAGFQTKNTEYVTGLYKDLLGREPEAEGLKYWTDALNAGTSRAELVVSLINSANSGTGADKANLAAKTEALNSFSNNFSDYNVLPGSETYDNARAQAGAEIKGITSSTNNPTTVVTSWLNNSGYKDKYQEDTPAPQGTTLYATYNDELRGEWANASDVANAEVTFKADTAEERALIRQAEEIGVTVNAATQNVSFKNLNGASGLLEKAVINSTPNSAAVVDTKGLADLPNITTIEDREGNTTLKIDTKIANLTTINMGNGNDNLNIADADQLSNNKVAVDMGQGGNDTLTLGKGDFSKAFSTISNVDTIVQGDKTTAAHLNLSQISSNISGTSTNDIKVTADKINFDGDIKLTVDALFKVPNSDPAISGAAKDIDISNIRGISANAQELTLDTVTNAGAVSAQLATVQGNSVDARLHEVLDLGKATFGSLTTIKDIYAVSANKATLQKASALSDGFNLRGELNVTPAADTDLVETSAGKKGIDLSKITSEALVGGTSIVNVDVSAATVSGAVAEIIGSKDANLVDNVVLKGGTYTSLEKISDASVVTTENNGSFETATLKNAKVLENGFNLKGNVKYEAAATDTAIDLSKVTGEFTDAAGTVKSVANIDLKTTGLGLTNLTKVVGSKDAELKEVLDLGSQDFATSAANKLEVIQDIDTVTSKGASIHNKAIVNGFALTKDSTDLNVKVAASDSVVDLSTVTAEANNAITLDIEQVTEGTAFKSALTSIKGSTAANIVDSYTAKATDTYASLTSISDINNLDLSALAKGSHDKLTSIEGGIANLGSGDFTALTTLTAAVRAASGDKVNTLSYDNLAGSGAFNLTLDGSDNKTAGANFVTLAATSKADATDLSAVKVAGNQAVTLAITGVNKNITLSDSKAYANIHEVINLDAAAIGNVTITGFGAGDSIKLPAGSNLQFTAGTFKEATAGTTALGNGSNYYVDMSKATGITAALNTKEGVLTVLDKFLNATEAAGKESTIAFNGTDGKSYIWQYNKTSAKTGVQLEDITLVSITDAKFNNKSSITANGSLFVSDASDPTPPPTTLSGVVAAAKTGSASVLDFDKLDFSGDATEKIKVFKDAEGKDLGNLYITGEANQLTLSGSAVNASGHDVNVFLTNNTSSIASGGAGTYTPDSSVKINAFLGGTAIKAGDTVTIASDATAVGAVTTANLTLANNIFVNTTSTVSFSGADLQTGGALAGKVSLKNANVADFKADVTLAGDISGDVNLTTMLKDITAGDKVSVASLVSGAGNNEVLTFSVADDTVTTKGDIVFKAGNLKDLGAAGSDTLNLSGDTTVDASDISGRKFDLSVASTKIFTAKGADSATIDLGNITNSSNSSGTVTIDGVGSNTNVTLSAFEDTVILDGSGINAATGVQIHGVATDDKIKGSAINATATKAEAYVSTGVAKDTGVTYNVAADISSGRDALAAALKGKVVFASGVNKDENATLFVTSNEKLYIYSATSNVTVTGASNNSIDANELALIATVDGSLNIASFTGGVVTFA